MFLILNLHMHQLAWFLIHIRRKINYTDTANIMVLNNLSDQ